MGLQHICPKVNEQNHNPKFIIDMDQNPIFIPSHSKKILEWKGIKSVNTCTSTDNTKRATLAVPVCADGKKLLLILIFKGTRKCQIVNKEIQIF